jgi:hypothetical protein
VCRLLLSQQSVFSRLYRAERFGSFKGYKPLNGARDEHDRQNTNYLCVSASFLSLRVFLRRLSKQRSANHKG